MTSTSTTSLNSILDKMASRDKDYRYMATSDLLTELQKEGFKIEGDIEKKLCQMIFKLMTDSAGDVQGLAVKCLPLLIHKTCQVDYMVDSLFKMVEGGKEDERDIASIGLKTILAEDQPAAGAAVSNLTPRLLSGVSGDKLEVTICCLEILLEVLLRFPSLVAADLVQIQAKLLPELASSRPAVRKRAVTCVGAMCGGLGDAEFQEVVTHLLDNIEASRNKASESGMATYMQAACAVARSTGHRLGPHLPQLVPLVLSTAGVALDWGEKGTDVAEHCLLTAEALVLRCPAEVNPFVEELVHLSLRCVKHDPNYADDEDHGPEAMDEDDVEEDEEEEDEAYSDDDDMSWKVRRAATKLTSALLSAKAEALGSLFSKVCHALLARFGEREESVRSDIFSTARLLVETAGNAGVGSTLQRELVGSLGRVISALRPQLVNRSMRTRQGAFLVSRELASALRGSLSEHMAMFLGAVDKSLRDKQATSALRLEVLVFLRLAIDTHPPEDVHAHIKPLTESVTLCVADRFYKIVAEALRTCGSLIRALRPAPPTPSQLDLPVYYRQIHKVVIKQLAGLDQDQEVKEAAIAAVGTIVSHGGDACPDLVAEAAPLLMDRVRNEITRLAAVRAFATIVASSLVLNIGDVIGPLRVELTAFLRKNSRPLRLGSMEALQALVKNHAERVGGDGLQDVAQELTPIIDHSDLALAAVALSVCSTLLDADAKAVATVIRDTIVPQVLRLVGSPMLQGPVMKALEGFMVSLVRHPELGLSFDSLLVQLLAVPGTETPGDSATASRQTLRSTAICVAALCREAAADARAATVARFVEGLSDSDPRSQLIAVHCLGCLGRSTDLSGDKDRLVASLMAAFGSSSDDLRSAAATALGSIAAGSVAAFLPAILACVADDERAGERYLLLQALKELILAAPSDALAPHVSDTLPLVLAHSGSNAEEGVRRVVSECLGKLLAASPALVLPVLHGQLQSADAAARAVAVSALRFAVVDTASPLDDALPSLLPDFLSCMGDETVGVRHAAVSALSCVAHNQPSYISGSLQSVMAPLFQETHTKPELVHEVVLGPFKHMVDDGLEARKAAFECLDTMLDAFGERLDLQAVVDSLVRGLSDTFEIKINCHLILSKMAARAQTRLAVLAQLDAIIEPLRKSIVAKLKENAVKQEVERHEELVRSGLRVCCILTRIPGAENVARFEEFVRTTLKQPQFAQQYEAACMEVDGGDVVSFGAEPMSMA